MGRRGAASVEIWLGAGGAVDFGLFESFLALRLLFGILGHDHPNLFVSNMLQYIIHHKKIIQSLVFNAGGLNIVLDDKKVPPGYH